MRPLLLYDSCYVATSTAAVSEGSGGATAVRPLPLCAGSCVAVSELLGSAASAGEDERSERKWLFST